MGRKTKIDWCDSSWNPVTGCYHDCPYCYARGIAKRFGSHIGSKDNLHVLDTPIRCTDTYCFMQMAGISAGRKQPYPFDFDPTFHRYKLEEPKRWRNPRNIFVCSMADLFGEWVPDEWITAVFDACLAAPQHRYLFLTKNPGRYTRLYKAGKLPNTIDCWWGASTSHMDDPYNIGMKTFASVEPILEDFTEAEEIHCGWVIIGAETGNRKGKVIPKKEWILLFTERCRKEGTPVFMKESLREIMGADFRQEFPWEV